MEPKHTPGPWDIKDGSKLRITAGKYGLHVAHIATTGMGHAAKANAALIAASPVMLEALKDIASRDPHHFSCDCRRCLAIAAAKGDR